MVGFFMVIYRFTMVQSVKKNHQTKTNPSLVSSWWLQPTHLKIMLVKLDHFPQIPVKNKRIFETTYR